MRLLAVVLAGTVLLLLCGAVATLVIARVIETRYPPAGRFVEVAGGRLHVVEMAPQGREPEATVLLLHGASGSSGDPMMALGERLAQRFRVVAVDRPGSGWSDRIGGAGAASPATQARIIRAALREIGIERVIVVGHSWGRGARPEPRARPRRSRFGAGAVGAGEPSLARRRHLLVLPPGDLAGAGAAPHLDADDPGWAPADEADPWGRLRAAGPPATYIERSRIPLVLRPRAFRANAEDVSGLYRFVVRQSRRYGAIRAPTAIVSGDADTIVWTNLHSRSLVREIPGARLVILPGVGHMPHHAAPDIVAREIEAVAAKP